MKQIEECSSQDDSSGLSDENGNVLDGDSDSASYGGGSRTSEDDDETTASYSSLEDEVVDSATMSTENATRKTSSDTEAKTTTDGVLDDNRNNVPSTSTNTSDSDSGKEMKKVSAKLKSLLPYGKNHKYARNFRS